MKPFRKEGEAPRPPLPPHAREDLIARDGDCCKDCGATDVPLEIEHTIPWWRVRHMSADRRAWYASLANLALRCASDCHKRKTRKEAAERGHQRRLEAKRENKERPPLRGRDGAIL